MGFATLEFPVVDCAEILKQLQGPQRDTAYKKFGDALGNGLQDFGLVYLINHGLEDRIDTRLKKTEDFFELPKEVKRKYKKENDEKDFFGYISYNEPPFTQDPILNPRESFDFWRAGGKFLSSFPEEVPGFEEAASNVDNNLRELAQDILRALAIYVGLDEDGFLNEHKHFQDRSIMTWDGSRANYYPKAPYSEDSLLHVEHVDTCSLAFLFQFQNNAEGYEALVNGQWYLVPPKKGAIIFSLGAYMEILSGGKLPALVHRVRASSDRETSNRLTIVSGMSPDGAAPLKPLVLPKENWSMSFLNAEENETCYAYAQKMCGFKWIPLEL